MAEDNRIPELRENENENANANARPKPNIKSKPKPTTRRPSNTTPRKTSTPIRKPSASSPKTPNTAPPARKGTQTRKGGDSTLFQDFLLGRPSPQRTGAGAAGAAAGRRKSLDVVKRELRLGAEELKKKGTPSPVKDRVREWQREIVVPPPPRKDAGREEEEEEEGDSVDEGGEERNGNGRIRDMAKRPGRRKSRDGGDISTATPEAKIAARMAIKNGNSRQRSKSAAAPKKRLISDDHWMKKAAATGGKKIPSDFLQKNAVNPPVERKIDDWIRRTEGPDLEGDSEGMKKKDERALRIGSRQKDLDTPTRRKVSRPAQQNDLDEEDTPRRRKVSRSVEQEDLDDEDTPRRGKPSKREALDDGIRIRSLPALEDDGIRVKPSRDNSFNAGDDSIRIKPMRRERRPKEEDPAEFTPPRKRSEKHLRPPDVESVESTHDEEDNLSWGTPSRRKSKPRRRKSSPTDSIPFGNSAFSVLDLPVGAEAGTMRRPAPKRNPSFAVPKVFKKAYNEGMKIVHDTVDPPRVGLNQPPSIESWLNSTSDPFVDRPASGPVSDLSVPDAPSRRKSYQEDDSTERDLMEDDTDRRRRRPVNISHESENNGEASKSDSPDPKTRDTLPSMENATPLSPSGLRRTPATRVTSSPKSARKVPLKEALLEAFRGESGYKGKGNPLADPSGYRDRDPSDFEDYDHAPVFEDSPPKPSPPVPRHASVPLPIRDKEKPLPIFPRRQAPTTGEHRLSTIASVETFSTSSSVTDTASELSHTTVTQSTVFTAPTASTLSRQSNNSGLKRRLTKHSDLLSVLSLPDSGQPGRAKSIRSARSMRTTRNHIDTATIQDLMKELSDDESKYIRELKTLVDGVIPVLLTCVLSKSDSAEAAGLFDEGLDASFTKPIVDMGVALERMKSLHTRIPLDDPKRFTTWLQGAHKTYDNYLTAWRMGFQDVVVNLAPASRSSSADQSPAMDELPRNANGDVVDSNGERVDVAFLLKRPLLRVKYLRKIMEGINKHLLSDLSKEALTAWINLEERTRRRTKEESARMVDRAANKTDTTRARDPETLALAEDVKIDQTRQVCAKDDFSLDMLHSSGQRIECQVQLIVRDKPSDKNDAGDVLIVTIEEDKQWLLFPPVITCSISARLGDNAGEVVVMIRDPAWKWQEMFLLKADFHDAATDIVDMLGSVPLPPPIVRDDISVISKLSKHPVTAREKENMEVPIGARSRKMAELARRQAEEEAPSRKEQHTPSHGRVASSVLSAESMISGVDPKDLNEAMKKAGKGPFVATKHARSRYHTRGEGSQTSSPLSHTEEYVERKSGYDCVFDDSRRPNFTPKQSHYMSGGLGDASEVSKLGTPSSTPGSPKTSTPLKESMRPKAEVLKKQQAHSPSPVREDGAPPPPAHRTPTTPNSLKKAPVLDSPTPQAKHRRTSSPLKHEYQPSMASGTSSSSGQSDSEDGSYSDTSDDDDLEAAELPELPAFPKRVSPSVSLYNLPNGSVAPSNSASQAPYRYIPTQQAPHIRKLVAFISSWNDKYGRWEDLHNGPCSIVVSPGKIEAFEMSAAHSSPRRDQSGAADPHEDPVEEIRPLIEQGLTPHVNLKRGVAVDLNITSRPTSNSLLKVTGNVIRYRTNSVADNVQLYNQVHIARMENPVFKQLELDRNLNDYGKRVYEDAVGTNKRRSFFGRKNSYRASIRAPSATASDEQSAQSLTSSTVSRLRRMSGSMFNIGKSTIATNQIPGSQYGSSSNSTFSGPTPPRTPTSPSLAGTMTSSGNNIRMLGNENLKIRLYTLLTRSSWDDRGAARITITAPLPGMRQRSTINQGITRRIIVTQDVKTPSFTLSKASPNAAAKEQIVVIDEILGADCFTRIGRSGVLCQIWDEVRGDNGEVGRVGKIGGVSGRTRKWCFQMKCEADAEWIFGLCAVRQLPVVQQLRQL